MNKSNALLCKPYTLKTRTKMKERNKERNGYKEGLNK